MLAKLLLVCLTITICAVAATAWVAATTTTAALRQQQNQRIADDSQVYSALVYFAATHTDWRDVGALVRSLAASSDYRIALQSPDNTPIADSATSGAPLPPSPSALVDPLNVDTQSAPGAISERISPDAVGPYRLTDAEHAETMDAADKALSCIQERGGTGNIVTDPSGHAEARSPMLDLQVECSMGKQDIIPTEATAVTNLETMANRCLSAGQRPTVSLKVVPSGHLNIGVSIREADDYTLFIPYTTAPAAVSACIGSARRDQLRPYVSPPALLYITSTDGAAPAAPGLTPTVQAKIAGAAALLLLIGIVVTVVIARRMSRPLRELASAAEQMRGGELTVRVKVTGRDEIGRLGTAFNEMAETRSELEDTRKSMIADIAHELRTPVSNIRGWLESVEDGISDPDPPFVSALLGQAVQLQHIITDLQDLALADAGYLALHPEVTWTSGLLRQVVQAHGAQARAAGVELSSHAPENWELHADAVRLRQALGNLVGNAIRYTSPGGSVHLAAHREERFTAFTVADTGTGISHEDLPRIFDRFWRADKSRTRSTGGSGLGLAIARKLVQAHGGDLTVVSTVGSGTTFTATVPNLPTSS